MGEPEKLNNPSLAVSNGLALLSWLPRQSALGCLARDQPPVVCEETGGNRGIPSPLEFEGLLDGVGLGLLGKYQACCQGPVTSSGT